MYHYHTASDFLYEVKQQFSKGKYHLELLLDELDFVLLSEDIIQLFDRSINVEIIVQGAENKKSLRLIHLFNRITQLGGTIHWIFDPRIDKELISYLILDKTYVISKSHLFLEVSTEEKIHSIQEMHTYFRTQAEPYRNLDGDISISFSVDKSIVTKGETVILQWEVKNANIISIEGIIEAVEASGKKAFTIESDRVFILQAENKYHKQSKKLYVKMIPEAVVDIRVKAYEPELDEYIELKAADSEKQHYYAFYDQNMCLSWETERMGVLHEKTLGTIALIGQHEFKLLAPADFEFLLSSMMGNHSQKIIIHPVENSDKKTWSERWESLKSGDFLKNKMKF